jgi:hypothetical protein
MNQYLPRERSLTNLLTNTGQFNFDTIDLVFNHCNRKYFNNYNNESLNAMKAG